MRRGWRFPSLALFLLLLTQLTRLGYGNEGSYVGSCYCDEIIPRSPSTDQMKHIQKVLKGYNNCVDFIRFQLRFRTICGNSKDPWVTELKRCFDSKECGRAYNLRKVVPQGPLPSPSTKAPELTERAPSDMGTPAQTYLPPILLQSTQKPTLPVEALSLDKNFTHVNKTITSSVSHHLDAGPETGEKQKQLEENVGPISGTSTVVTVLSLLAIIFILTAVLFYVICKKREQSLQHSPDLKFHYTPVAPDSNFWSTNGSL